MIPPIKEKKIGFLHCSHTEYVRQTPNQVALSKSHWPTQRELKCSFQDFFFYLILFYLGTFYLTYMVLLFVYSYILWYALWCDSVYVCVYCFVLLVLFMLVVKKGKNGWVGRLGICQKLEKVKPWSNLLYENFFSV